MKINWNWGAFFRALTQAFAAAKANAPLPASPPVTGDQIAAAATALQAALPGLIAEMKQYSGVVVGAEILLDVAARMGVPYAALAEQGLEATPATLAGIQSALPWIMPFLGSLFSAAPAATPIVPSDPTQFSRGR